LLTSADQVENVSPLLGGGNRLGGSITFDPNFISAVEAGAGSHSSTSHLNLRCFVTIGIPLQPPNVSHKSAHVKPKSGGVFRPRLEAIAIEGVHHCDQEEHIYTLALQVDDIDFTLGKSRVKASQVNMTLEGFKDGQSLTWEGTMSGNIEYEYDGLANSFAMQTEFQLEWSSDAFKRARFSGEYRFESADERITVDGEFEFNYPCYSDPAVGPGQTDNARHVIGCQLTQETRV